MYSTNLLAAHVLTLCAVAYHRIYAIASQLSPVDHSSGIECLEAGTFNLHCFQTLTGIYLWWGNVAYIQATVDVNN